MQHAFEGLEPRRPAPGSCDLCFPLSPPLTFGAHLNQLGVTSILASICFRAAQQINTAASFSHQLRLRVWTPQTESTAAYIGSYQSIGLA